MTDAEQRAYREGLSAGFKQGVQASYDVAKSYLLNAGWLTNVILNAQGTRTGIAQAIHSLNGGDHG